MVRSSIDVPGLDADSRRLLAESGLPGSAAPCLSFRECAKMPRIWEVFSPGQWKEEQKSHLSSFRMLGPDGAGNPICVDEDTGEVWLLDHEDWFRIDQFVNSSVAQLAECLLLFMEQRETDLLSKAIEDMDSRALAENGFWYHEVACFREDGG